MAARFDKRGVKSITQFERRVGSSASLSPTILSYLYSFLSFFPSSASCQPLSLSPAGRRCTTCHSSQAHTCHKRTYRQAGGTCLKAVAGLVELYELVTVRGTRVQVTVSPTAPCYRSKPCSSYYTPLSLLCFSTPPPLHPQSSLPPCTCVCMQELNTFKGVRRGPPNPQRRLGSGSPPSRFIASVLPKSYFTVPSIRSLGSPQLPSPDAGLSPSLGTRTGHGERGGM